MREVVARVAALLRRVERAAALAATRPGRHRASAACAIDPGARRTTVGGEAVHLTPTEFDLLLCLAREPGQVLSRERLLARRVGLGRRLGERQRDPHRRQPRQGAAQQGRRRRIRTVHGVGYALEDA